jgi:NADH-quinone oxidoreductase subunit D
MVDTQASLGRFDTEELRINMGPQHPSTHGVLRLIPRLDGETVNAVECDIGFLHRGIEKLAEKRTYAQFIPITDRLDYLAAMHNNYCFAAAAEKLMGIEAPPRAQLIRVIAMELNRIASHLLFCGCFGLDLGATTPFIYTFREREKVYDLFEMLCGARMTYNFIRIGGVSFDIPGGFVEQTTAFLDELPDRIREYDNLLSKNEIFLVRTRGIGVLDPDLALDWGVTGPTLRASGPEFDLRRVEPYCGYETFEFEVVVGDTCDCFARYMMRLWEMLESARIVRQALARLEKGPVMAKVPRVIRPPEGEAYARVESPRGELGCYLVSKGGPSPYRMKWRAPCFSNLAALSDMAVGLKVADLIACLASIDLVLGDVDR